jgi:hypothetical protein
MCFEVERADCGQIRNTMKKYTADAGRGSALEISIYNDLREFLISHYYANPKSTNGYEKGVGLYGLRIVWSGQIVRCGLAYNLLLT